MNLSKIKIIIGIVFIFGIISGVYYISKFFNQPASSPSQKLKKEQDKNMSKQSSQNFVTLTPVPTFILKPTYTPTPTPEERLRAIYNYPVESHGK